MVKNTKTLKLVVSMSLIIALAISALSLSVRATYENTHNNTGNQASDIVGIASTQVGYYEGGNGYTKYGDWYGLPYSDWCAMFVSWCANQAGVGTDVFPSFALCSAGADWFISQGRFHYAGSYAPQAGDLIFYASYGNIYHVGLVTGSDGSNVYSIEGNYNEAVYNVSYPLSYGDIMGYATPAYGTASLSTAPAAAPADDDDSEEFDDSEEIEVTFEDTQADDSDEDAAVSDEDEIIEETDLEQTDVEETTPVDVDTDDEDSDEDAAADTDSDDTEETPVLSGVAGDADGDGVVTSADALLIQRYLAQKLGSDVDKFVFLNADADASGEINIQDALYALTISVGAA